MTTTQTTDTTDTQEPRLVRLDIGQDLADIRVAPSDWRQEAYGQWTTHDGRRVLRIEPMTLEQLAALEDSIRAARLRFVASLNDQARDLAAAGGGR